MPKKVVMQKSKPVSTNAKKTSPVKKTIVKKTIQRKPIVQSGEINRTLVQNFVGLQKIMTDLVMKLDSVSNQMIQLLNIFETSAKTLAEKGGMQKERMIDKQILEKIEGLIDQNKTIARGVSMLHGDESQQPTPKQTPPQQPREMSNNQNDEKSYQKSISSKPQSFTPIKRL